MQTLGLPLEWLTVLPGGGGGMYTHFGNPYANIRSI